MKDNNIEPKTAVRKYYTVKFFERLSAGKEKYICQVYGT
jgi:hypothetical protein